MLLQDKNLFGNFYPTHVSHNNVVLQKTWRLLAKRFDLPGAPTIPYETKMDMPLQLLTFETIMEQFRLRKEVPDETASM